MERWLGAALRMKKGGHAPRSLTRSARWKCPEAVLKVAKMSKSSIRGSRGKFRVEEESVESRKHTAHTGEASSARELRALARSLYDPVRWA